MFKINNGKLDYYNGTRDSTSMTSFFNGPKLASKKTRKVKSHKNKTRKSRKSNKRSNRKSKK